VIPRRRSSVLRDLGDYTGARAGFQRALAIDEAALGARLHVRPWFADRPIERIGPADVRRWQRDLAAKVGPATLGHCRSLALRIFQFALDEGAIDTNSVGKVPAPSAAPTPTWSCGPASAAPLTPEEAGQLLACFPPVWWDHVITLLGTGLRIGELAGLHRRRVQLNQPVPTLQVVDVRYQAGRRFGSGFKPRPKSDASIREVPLAPRSWSDPPPPPGRQRPRRRLVHRARRRPRPARQPGVRRGTRTVPSRHNFRRTYHGALAKLADPATAGLRPEMATRLVAAVEERLAVVLATAEAALDQQRPSQRCQRPSGHPASFAGKLLASDAGSGSGEDELPGGAEGI
jgi:integrase